MSGISSVGEFSLSLSLSPDQEDPIVDDLYKHTKHFPPAIDESNQTPRGASASGNINLVLCGEIWGGLESCQDGHSGDCHCLTF